MIPYGYKIENGYAIADPETAPKVKAFFKNYLEGLECTSVKTSSA